MSLPPLATTLGFRVWPAVLAAGSAVLLLLAVFALRDCDLPLWLRCLGGCPTYAEVVERHAGAPESRCVDGGGEPRRVVIVDVRERHWFDIDGDLVAVQVEATRNGAFCDGSRSVRWFGPTQACR